MFFRRELRACTEALSLQAGADDVPADVWKQGGSTITKRLRELFCRIWEAEEVQQQYKDAEHTSICKKKVELAV